MAEREGFEPPDPRGSTVFKTAAFDRSATSPFLEPNRLLNLSVFVTHLPPKMPAAYPGEPRNGRLNKPGIMCCRGQKAAPEAGHHPCFRSYADPTDRIHHSEVLRSRSRRRSGHPTLRHRRTASTVLPGPSLKCNPAERYLAHQPVQLRVPASRSFRPAMVFSSKPRLLQIEPYVGQN